MAITVEEFTSIVGGEAHGFAPGAVIDGFVTDNRDARPGDLFLAIKGARADGHDFVSEAIALGALGALVEREVAGAHILVPNLVEALAKLASHFRDSFHGPVIGITGSAGKTTTKEFVAAALSTLGRVLKTQGNRNTEFTAPLVWAELKPDTKAVVVEMAMRGFGQIKHLASFSKPTIGIVTNVGFSHLSEVGSREGIAQAKGELLESLPKDGVAILWQEDPYLDVLRRKAPGRVITYGYSEQADCRITDYKATSWTTCAIRGAVFGAHFEAELPAVGRHIALGAAAAITVVTSLSSESDLEGRVRAAAKALRRVELPPMRMEVIDLNGATVLLDTYNAAPPSMLAAIETFAELPCEGRRLAVIGEMRELGSHADAAHREIGVALAKSGIDEAIFYSGPAALAAEEARMHGLVVHIAQSLVDVALFLRQARPGDAVLVKGSRSLELERTVDMARHPMGAGC